MSTAFISTSKLISLVLRHKPESIGLTLDEEGWASVAQLITCLNAVGTPIDRNFLEKIVSTSDKKRFVFNVDGSEIRANQGHSVNVDLGYSPLSPPINLFHGTATRFLASIEKNGLLKRERHHVHLSADVNTAKTVGGRHGKVVVLAVDASRMQKDGYLFYRSENDVWLTETVPFDYISILECAP